MADHTGIEWTDATWNVVVGCSLASPGCTHCYAMGQAARIIRCAAGSGRETHYAGTVETVKGRPVWSGKLALAPDHILTQPLRWKRPRKIFVNSMGDLFHEDVPDEWIDRVFAVMALAPQHTFQILTKRSARMRKYMSDAETVGRLVETLLESSWNDPDAKDYRAGICYGEGRGPKRAWRPLPKHPSYQLDPWPLPNVWLGVSAEDQRRADERIPDLLATPAAIRFVSAEPLLGPIDFTRLGTIETIAAALPEVVERCRSDARPSSVSGMQIDAISGPGQSTIFHQTPDHMGGFSIRFPRPFPRLDWVIVGGESGKGARPMHPGWARSIRDQCGSAGTAFFFKQWGEWAPGESCSGRQTRAEDAATFYGGEWASPGWHYERISVRVSEEMHCDDEPDVWRVGKARAGRLLDGVTHDAMPGVRP